MSSYGATFGTYLRSALTSLSSMSSQFSILFSLIRIDPSKLMQSYLYLISALFSLICFFLMAQLIYVWNWWEIKAPQCILSTQVAICKLTCRSRLSLPWITLIASAVDTVIDLLLGLPIKLFIILQDKWWCHCVTVIFSTCIITSIVAIIYILNQKSWLLLLLR